MKINILFEFNNGPYGGGNQFLKALKKYFSEKQVYEENIINAEIILFNSHHQFSKLIKYKKKYSDKIFIHRIDGPIFLIRNDNMLLDSNIYKFNRFIADATIFQSEWSKQENLRLGIENNLHQTTIINAPNSEVFNCKNRLNFSQERKIRIIATSWSANIRKGFEVYKWLDKNLDFSKYEMTFCGNTPFVFENIKHIKPLPSNLLAEQLKKHDIFITASQKDPCSNSLIEALHTGLPAIVLKDGGHPEIVAQAGEVFDKNEEIIIFLDKIKNNYFKYQNNIKLPQMNEVGNKYYNFIKSVYKTKQQQKNTKKLNFMKSINLHKSILIHKFSTL